MVVQALPVEKLDEIVLTHGSHQSRADGVCAMELVAWLAGEPHSDAPECASPVITAFVVAWNDAIQDDETRTRLLRPLLPRIVGTRSTPAVEQRRADLALDWLVRVQTPAWLELAKLTDDAAALRALPPLLDRSAVIGSQAALDTARAHSAAAWDAARDAARDAAWDAARAAAWDAARDAARAAARDAARAAAWDAARAAAWDAARDAAWDAARDAATQALRPTVESLQRSALDLLEQMIAVTPESLQ